ncbi:NACHT domain-containing protein [Pseudomonas sp. OHS18]|uniref:NACHT domain-containing protein n=1 Tax=Pseudomonas sp. OHS18 TaxID=3399679 RepID=UPI003A83B68C
MPDFSAAIALLKKPLDDVYSFTKDEVKAKLAIVRTAAKMKQLHKKLYETQRVKTIWHIDRPSSLSSFFHPVSIVTHNLSVIGPFRLNSLEVFEGNHNIIFGTVGQGKSILLRYLLGREIKSGVRIPVFLELRNLGDKKIADALTEKFSSVLGIASDYDVFSSFADRGKVSFLLDGFDEVDPFNVARTLTEIEELSYKYQDCKIVLTSRPDSECRHLTSFYSNKIQPLDIDSLQAFYKKITRDPEFSARLHAAIKTSPTKIRELVTTPLLATLLAISYRNVQKIPLDFAEFYDDLFQILLVRHDVSKLGWRRSRKSKLDDRQVQQVFEAFCFATRRKNLLLSIKSRLIISLQKAFRRLALMLSHNIF